MKALVTGGAGFIGCALARHLAEAGGRVDLVDNFARGTRDAEINALLTRPGLRMMEIDLTAPDACTGLDRDYDAIFHLAAIVGVANVADRPRDVLQLNIAMQNTAMALAARQTALDRFVFMSTSEVYAGTLEAHGLPFPTPEDTPLTLPDLGRPRTSYMLSKIYGEALCRHAGLPITIVRPHNIYGPRMGVAHVIPELMARILKLEDGASLEVFSPDHMRTFCYIDDAITMIRRLAEAPQARRGTFNIGNDAPEIRIGDLAQRIVALVGRKVTIAPGPETAGSPTRRCPDIARMRAATGFAPAVSIDDGLTATWSWYREFLSVAQAGAKA